MEDCIFCKIVNKEVPSYGVYEDESNVAFLDIRQSAPGHVMVVPKKHGKTILDLNENELGKWMGAVQKVIKKIKKAMECSWMTIGINHEEKSGVPHLHIHLIPRWDNDNGGIIQSIVKNPPKDSLTSIADKIRKA